MTAFEGATNRIQGENVVTSSFVIPSIIGLKKHLRSKTWKYNLPLAEKLEFELGRLNEYDGKKHFQRATFLDPRFKFRCFSEERANELKEDLIIFLQNQQTGNGSRGSVTSWPIIDSHPTPKKTIFTFFDEVPVGEADPISSEMNDYLKDPFLSSTSCPLSYWNDK